MEGANLDLKFEIETLNNGKVKLVHQKEMIEKEMENEKKMSGKTEAEVVYFKNILFPPQGDLRPRTLGVAGTSISLRGHSPREPGAGDIFSPP